MNQSTLPAAPPAACPALRPVRRWVVWAQVAAALLLAAVVAGQAQRRTDFNIKTETDYVAGFHKEAARLLAGEPLLVRFHPPGYAAVLAAVQPVVRDWFTTGLLVSAGSAAVALLASAALFRGLAGGAAGWGVLAAWAGSVCFFAFAVQATSDAFGVAVYQCVWLAALGAWRSPAWWRWAALGGLVGVGVLARSDLIITAPLVLLPLVSDAPWRPRLARAALVAATALVPVAAWLSYARATGSPPWPTLTYANLALTYFSGSTDTITGDAREPLEDQFNSLGDVLWHDPLRIATQYTRSLLQLPALAAWHLSFLPLALLAVPGVFLLLRRARRPFVWVFLGLTAAHVLMVNLKSFEPRYYLFLVPWLGAAAGVAAAAAVGRLPRPGQRYAAWAAIALVMVGATGYAAHRGYWLSESRRYQAEVHAAAAALRAHSRPGDAVCARKPLLAYHADRVERSFPIVTDLPALAAGLANTRRRAGDVDVFLLYGSIEHTTRPALAQLADARAAPPWLVPVGQGVATTPWVLYRFVPEAVPASDDAPAPP